MLLDRTRCMLLGHSWSMAENRKLGYTYIYSSTGHKLKCPTYTYKVKWMCLSCGKPYFTRNSTLYKPCLETYAELKEPPPSYFLRDTEYWGWTAPSPRTKILKILKITEFEYEASEPEHTPLSMLWSHSQLFLS